jgi:hypothetical protein
MTKGETAAGELSGRPYWRATVVANGFVEQKKIIAECVIAGPVGGLANQWLWTSILSAAI